jgi:hypothetical protein
MRTQQHVPLVPRFDRELSRFDKWAELPRAKQIEDSGTMLGKRSQRIHNSAEASMIRKVEPDAKAILPSATAQRRMHFHSSHHVSHSQNSQNQRSY